MCVCLCKCNSAVYCGCVCVWVGWRPRERARRSATVAATASVGPRVWRNSLAIRRGYKKTHTNTQQHIFFISGQINSLEKREKKQNETHTHAGRAEHMNTNIYRLLACKRALRQCPEHCRQRYIHVHLCNLHSVKVYSHCILNVPLNESKCPCAGICFARANWGL